MSRPTDTGNVAGESQTRVDLAHVGPGDESAVAIPPQDLLQAISGRDTEAAALQLRAQALELTAVLRDKQRLLEQRESELNARAALMERDLRQVRLKQLSSQVDSNPSVDPPAAPDCNAGGPLIEAEATVDDDTPRKSPSSHKQKDPSPHSMTAAVEQPVAVDVDELRRREDQLAQDRAALGQREVQLDKRQRALEKMHDELSELHRETLQLRLATEYRWDDLIEEFPTDQVDDPAAIAQLRSQLDDHYRMANEELTRRHDDLQARREELDQQHQTLRHRRREVQLWADRRLDEIETRAANLALCERQIDQQESELQGQSLLWQQQRESYRDQMAALQERQHSPRRRDESC